MKCNPALFQVTHKEQEAWGENLIYGSLTSRGVATMVKTIRNIVGNSANIEGLDLGCGDGELIYHLQNELPGSHWYGVEICASRVEKQSRPVFIWQGDMFEESLHSYNILHADNLCLEERLAERLEAKIAQEFRGLYITYRLPKEMTFLRRAIYLKSEPTETTWTTHTIHYYEL